MDRQPKTYAESGVSIKKGDEFARYIANLSSPALTGSSIGGFAGGVEIDTTRYRRPVLLSTTDGVGTKLLVARRLGKFDTLGIDLVAMCVNDLAVCGAQPLVFLDYIATGVLDESLLHQLIAGVVRGCEMAGCRLAGGETAEMPDVYKPGDFDLAGFCSGVVDRDKMLPQKEAIRSGDPIFGIASSGIHSNGFSLARKVLENSSPSVWEELLTPTAIYVQELVALAETGLVRAMAHITGGGLVGNFARVIPQTCQAQFSWDWPVPAIFERIQTEGRIDTNEMRQVFNMGLGVALCCSRADASALVAKARSLHINLLSVGVLSDA